MERAPEMYNDLTKKCIYSVMNDLCFGSVTYLCKSPESWVFQKIENKSHCVLQNANFKINCVTKALENTLK